MIPKIIHYCWFGGQPLPKLSRKCIASWKRYFPDYEIKEWNESNFDVHSIPYTSEAYERKKYAFVSDYARFYILYREGGIYFDTDVEVICPFDEILQRGAFMGMENNVGVNSGLGLAAETGNTLYKEIINHYTTLHFIDSNGNILPGTVVKHVTDVLSQHGYKPKQEPQQVDDITIYPNEWFNPLDDATGILHITAHTHSIHWYAKTWVEHYGPVRRWTARLMHRWFGVESLSRLKKLIKR